MTDHGAANAGANPRARAPNHAVRVGDCVTVGPKHRVGAQNSEGGVGFVVARHDNTKFDLKAVEGHARWLRAHDRHSACLWCWKIKS